MLSLKFAPSGTPDLAEAINVFVKMYFSEFLLEFPCKWNYRPDHCIYGSNCASAEEDGVYVLHGNRGVYHDAKQPAFRAVYEAIKQVGGFVEGYFCTKTRFTKKLYVFELILVSFYELKAGS